ncbi:sacsin N-terminal ATP-binding-like domain-containing protein, partial [Streptomyces beijiangensis]|nr:molecular chaperone Hsp90 [Streptomyces beijiangensis]
AAARAGVPGKLRLTLREGTLAAANTGAPLDAVGVESLSTLRASAKRTEDDTNGAVGRFGVGFAAVLAVSDEPAVVGRHGGAEDLATRLLDGIDDALLLTLPGLGEIVVDTVEGVRTLTRSAEGPYIDITDSANGTTDTTRWRISAAHGALDPKLLEGRPVEERLRPHWAVTWAVPVDAEGAPVRPRTAPVVHAPTPTDEPLGVPALLIASLPLDPT